MSSRSATALESCGCTSTMSDSVNQRIRSMSCTARSMTTPTFDIRGGNGPTRVMPIERISSPEIACLIAATAGLKRSTWPTISVTPARRAASTMSRPSCDRGRNRLLDQDMDVARDAGERDLVMKMGRRRDRHGIDALREQLIEVCESAAADQLGGARPMLRQRIDDADQRDVGQARQHAGMVAAHHARADNAHAQCALDAGLRARCGPL